MKKSSGILAACFLVVVSVTFLFARPSAPRTARTNPQVIYEDHHDVSVPLEELIAHTPQFTGDRREAPLYNTGRPRIVATGPDTAVQNSPPTPVIATVILNFPGLGSRDYGFQVTTAPPDMNNSVGITQIVQWVNLSFAVFARGKGTLIAGPTPGNTLWSKFGGVCETQNSGEPIIKFDQLAKRWVAAQEALDPAGQNNMYCVAVSTSTDFTGTFNRYAFPFGPSLPLSDKLSVWSDAYYVGMNVIDSNGAFLGSQACALNRAAMLTGGASTAICFQESTVETSLLPSDLDGATPPPAGEPDFFMDLFDSTTLHTFQFHVDFINPLSSTFFGPVPIAVAPYTDPCAFPTPCIPQPPPGELLDSNGDRLMYRLAYRNFGDHEALVATHSVRPTGSNAISALRWYEIRSPLTPTVFQQGTFQNSAISFWMGSIAMDKVGDILIGFSASSPKINPSILFTGRIPTDPLGTLEGSQLLQKGGGVQVATGNRWGDYSSMAIDPTNDCVFLYTNEYYKTTGSFLWSTDPAGIKFKPTHSPLARCH